jgi:photosystem II stability/assembly factor-like uncharacterized protein
VTRARLTLVAAALLAVDLFGTEAPSQSAPAWTRVVTGVTARLRGLSAPSARVIWASGTNGTVIRSADSGATWSRLDVPDSASLDFRDVDAVDDRTAYVLSIGNGDASRIYKTSDAGRTWTLQFKNQDPRGFFDAMTFRDARRGLAIGDSIDGRMVLLTTTDGGARWTLVPSGLPPALENEGAYAASGTNVAIVGERIWIATSRSRVVRSTDGGRTWTATPTAIPSSASAGIFSIAFADESHGLAVGGDYKLESAAVDNAAITTDGGGSWMLVKGLGGFRSAAGFVPSLPGLAVAVGPSGADYSSDGGRTWRAIAGPGFHTLAVVRGTRTVWAAGEHGAVARLQF